MYSYIQEWKNAKKLYLSESIDNVLNSHSVKSGNIQPKNVLKWK